MNESEKLSVFSILLRLAAIGLVILSIVAAFAYQGGWLSPHRITPRAFADLFEKTGGLHQGFRRNHAKGVCVAGSFDSSGQAAALSRASVFKTGSVPVIGRFALAGGNPAVTDAASAVRSMALLFKTPDGQEWRTGMNDIPVFIVKTPQDFYAQMQAFAPDPATGKPDPVLMQAFLARHPETARAFGAIKSYAYSSGFGDAAYNSLDAFLLIDDKGQATPVRWAMLPVLPPTPMTPDQAASDDKNYLFDDLAAQIRQGPLQWHLVITLGQADDATDDATVAWPDDRPKIDAGTLTIDRIESEQAGNCRDINFDPLVLPDGIAPSDDPLLGARSAVYAKSFTSRAGEPKPPSAVIVPAPTVTP